MLFRYRGWTRDGIRMTGELEAPSRAVALERLWAREILPDRIWPIVPLFARALGKGGRTNLRQLALLCGQVSMLLDGGVPLLQALQVVSEQARPPLKGALREVAEGVEGGRPLSEALTTRRDLFPAQMVQVITVAEVSGDLAPGLEQLGHQFDREDQIQRKVKSALVYPTVVLTMAFGLLVFMIGFMVPRYAQMFAQFESELPPATQALISLANLFKAYWWVLPPLGAAVWLAYRQVTGRSESVRLAVHKAILRAPVFGPLLLKRDLARYTQALSTTLRAGVLILQAAVSAAEVLENHYLERQLLAVSDSMARGETLTQALRATSLLPPIMMELLGVGEVTGRMDETLLRVSRFLEADVSETVERMTSVLEPFLIVTLGGIVLATIIPMLMPMFDIYAKIS